MVALVGCTDARAKVTPDSSKSRSLAEASVSSSLAQARERKKCRLENGELAKLPKTVQQYPKLRGIATVEMQLSGGTVLLEVNGECAPVTAGNFIDLVKKGFYDGLTFHRVVREPQPFVVQGGDPQGNGLGSYVDPKTQKTRYIPLEIMVKDSADKVPSYSKTLAPLQEEVLTHQPGALAMARSQFPDSASSQFYITLAEATFLDGNYAVFGKVLQGMELVQKIAVGDRILSLKLVSGGENLVF
ncbi:MAG: peptidylprolyl isomerase [Pseudanabaenaceae cyanobacterium bins.68]|nr:peptidylprolyl isomerase [Pseudanabaenaceae cyanobacterium bins.68]